MGLYIIRGLRFGTPSEGSNSLKMTSTKMCTVVAPEVPPDFSNLAVIPIGVKH